MGSSRYDLLGRNRLPSILKAGLIGWSNHQIDRRQISKRKEPHLIHTCVWEPHIHERGRDSTCRRGSKTEREHGDIGHPELGCGKVPWGLPKVMAGDRRADL